jgi:hypothetical protein
MCSCAQFARENAASLALFAATSVLFALLVFTNARLGLDQNASNRFRFHAIPVALSQLHHNRPHDYTAFRTLAHRFHDTSRPLDDQIAEAITSDPGIDTYFWVADDRGLSDFVACAFRLFGEHTRSLSKFWFLLLALSIGLFTLGFWTKPSMLVLPAFVLFGLLVLAEALPFRDRIPFDGRIWQDSVALYESRLFDALSLVSLLHLALVVTGLSSGRGALLTAIPQVVLLVFLYHARSSLGWQYLAVFSLVVAKCGWCVARRECRERREFAGSLFVAALLGLSLVGLNCYKHATYHPAYFAEQGNRTLWHNALMGLSHHPGLREELPMRQCEDRDAIDLVLARMQTDNPQLDVNAWNWMAALNSLGSHNSFDWPAYEATARAIYFDLWRTRTTEMLTCHAVYKPLAVAKQSAVVLRIVGKEAAAGRAWELLAAFGVLVCVCFGLFRAGMRDDAMRSDVNALCLVMLALFVFALIPAVAFYPAITTTAGFFVGAVAFGWLMAVQVMWRVSRMCTHTAGTPA